MIEVSWPKVTIRHQCSDYVSTSITQGCREPCALPGLHGFGGGDW